MATLPVAMPGVISFELVGAPLGSASLLVLITGAVGEAQFC